MSQHQTASLTHYNENIQHKLPCATVNSGYVIHHFTHQTEIRLNSKHKHYFKEVHFYQIFKSRLHHFCNHLLYKG